jgi:hypothetical protein
MNARPIRYPALLVALTLAQSALADTVTVWASHDTTIFQDNFNNSDGGGPALYAGTNGSMSPRRALLYFDIADNLPAGATITSVQLVLTLAQVAGTGMGEGAGAPQTIRLYPLAQSWGEGTNGTGSTIMMSGGGSPANAGDATWDAAFYSATSPTLWNSPGGDFVSTASASTSVSGTTVNIPFTWGSTPQLVADARGWYNNPSSNFGWILKNDDETDARTYYAFYSREGNSNASDTPQLIITYTVPEPQTWGLLAAGGLYGLRRWRRAPGG